MFYYSLIGILALIVLFITNHEELFKRNRTEQTPVTKSYRRFLIGVTIYYMLDICWGFLNIYPLSDLLFLDTELVFVGLALCVLFWKGYVIAYLGVKSVYSRILNVMGNLFFIGTTILSVVNIFWPVMFWVDDSGSYHTLPGRFIVLSTQVLLLVLTSVYTLYYAALKKTAQRKERYLTIGLFGLLMLAFIIVQLYFPMVPLYSIGYMLGCCLLRTFVIENEKEEYRSSLETALEREKKQLRDLNTAWELAYTDALTGAKSKLAHAQKEDQMDRKIAQGTLKDMAVAVFDVNGLKHVNDTLGHGAGDRYIMDAFHMICDVFQHSPVFRIGGDEFLTVMENRDYDNREELFETFAGRNEENRRSGKVVVSAGYAEFIPGTDESYKMVFERADNRMYEAKEQLKKGRA